MLNTFDLDLVANLAASKDLRMHQYETFSLMQPSSNMDIDLYDRIAQIEETSYTSVRTILAAFAKLANPKSYLEIGTRRGHSLCMVVSSAANPMDVYSFDMWIQDYAGETNPGYQLIKQELQKLNFKGTIQFFSGDSKETIPAFFQDPSHPQEIDLIFVDGDHSDEGARIDILNVVDHVAVGGLLVFDDITHPSHTSLHGVWHAIVDRHPDFESRECTDYEYGWAIAYRTARTTEVLDIVNGFERDSLGRLRRHDVDHSIDQTNAGKENGIEVVHEQQDAIASLTQQLEHVSTDSQNRLDIIRKQQAIIDQQQATIADLTRRLEEVSTDSEARLRIILTQQERLDKINNNRFVKLLGYLHHVWRAATRGRG